MRFSPRSLATCLAMAVLAMAAGCGGGTSPDATSADGSANAPPQSDGPTTAQAAGTGAEELVDDPKHPIVVIDTSLGKITVRLDAENAPLTVDNFLSYVDDGHYDETIFHQVIKSNPKVVIGGAYAADLSEKPTHIPVYNEAYNGLKNRRGTIAMARRADAVDSATCHFFLNLTNNDVLDHQDRTLDGYGYCVFGEIVAGLDVADKIGSVAVHDTEQFEEIPTETVVIRSIRRLSESVARRATDRTALR